MATKKTREKVGSFWTDTGTVLLGDPCQFIPDKRREGEKPELTYDELCSLFHGGEAEPQVIEIGGERLEFPRYRPDNQAVTIGKGHGIAVRVGCDGWCHVHVESDKNGPRRIVIDIGRTTP